MNAASTGYAFWCSRCRARHAGDCPTAAPLAPAQVAVTVGSLWRPEFKSAQEWIRTPFVYEVKSFNPATLRLGYVQVEPSAISNPYAFTDAEVCTDDGIELKGVPSPHMRLRFVARNARPDHDWQHQPLIAPSAYAMYTCKGCGKTEGLTLVQVMTATIGGAPLPLPWGPCP